MVENTTMFEDENGCHSHHHRRPRHYHRRRHHHHRKFVIQEECDDLREENGDVGTTEEHLELKAEERHQTMKGSFGYSEWTFDAAFEAGEHEVGDVRNFLAAKAQGTVDELGDRYVILAPWMFQEAAEMIDELKLENVYLDRAVYKMKLMGFRLLTGRWRVPGQPLIIMFDIDQAAHRVVHRYRMEFERDEKITIPYEDEECINNLVFAYLAAEFMAQFNQAIKSANGEEVPIVVQCHDWRAGIAALFLRRWSVNLSVMLVVHSALLSQRDFHYNSHHHRHRIQRAAAHAAHVMTATSETVAMQAAALLGRMPDVLTPYGAKFHGPVPIFHESREKITNFVARNLSVEKLYQMYVLVSGRYDCQKKGIDFLVDSLTHLSPTLRADVVVVAFLVYPAALESFNWAMIESAKEAKELERIVWNLEKKFGQPVYDHETGKRLLQLKNGHSWDDADAQRLDNAIFKSKRNVPPPMIRRKLINPLGDTILDDFRRINLFNLRHNQVKIILYPPTESSAPLMGLDYLTLASGCDVVAFPTRNWWVYSPPECAAMGTPCITTTKSSFGDAVKLENGQGIFTMETDSTKQLAECLLTFTRMSSIEKQNQRNAAARLAQDLKWDETERYFDAARRLAVERNAYWCLPNPPSLESGNKLK